MAGFNLIDEPFIPCLMPKGKELLVGLRDALARAHEISEVREASPLVTAALHRLLLTLLHRVFGPENLAVWRQMWKEERFDTEAIENYFRKWRSRFDVFESDHPFYQTAHMSTERPLPVSALFEELAGGNNATLFDHSTSEDPNGVMFAAAARGLIARQGFALGLGVSPDVVISGKAIKTGNRKDGPLARGLLLLVRGENLFRTLMLNLSEYPLNDRDIPVWEQDDPESLMDRTTTTGRLDLYTFQCRRLRLVHPENGDDVIRHVYFAQGRTLSGTEVDPMKPYHRNEEHGLLVFPLNEDRALWRDSATLFELARPSKEKQEDWGATALRWVREAAEDGFLQADCLQFDAFGVGTQRGKATSVILWRHDRLPLPVEYLANADLVADLKTALAAAEDVSKALREAAWMATSVLLAPLEGQKPDTDRVRAIVDSLAPERLYWSRLEEPFRQLLVELPGDAAHRLALLRKWFDRTLCRTAKDTFHRTAGELDRSARVLRAAVEGERRLEQRLWNIAKDDDLAEKTAPQQETAHA